jgi:predicted ATPase/DNA-binding CsgD family transcriptional regulator
VGGSAVAAAASGVHGFPVALTSFVGRAGPMRDVVGLLGQYRLVTVTGPGGSGKTRLACEVAQEVCGRFADGAWLVELAPVHDPAQVASAVGAGLGVREQPGVAAAEALTRALARQQLLLVLDNCEHVIGAAAELCAGLLDVCDDVRLLATSREPLAVAGEARYRLGPLSLPGPDDANAAGGSEAAALFADRARSADAHFTLDGPAAGRVGRLVTRLDGMPLAIELAAARVEALGVAQLLERIDDRFTLLVAGDRLAAGRQRSLAATVEWSYLLLDEAERRVFRQLSVFPGPFTLEGAEAVAGDGAAAAVVRLVDCSLLSPPRAEPDDQARYVMLETLRAYGAGLLAGAGEQEQAAAALAGYALAVAEGAAAGLQTTTDEVAAALRLDAEDATMRQVLTWAREHDPAAALRLAVALGFWWSLRGRLASHYALLRQAAGHAEVGSGEWCAAQFFLGWAALFSDNLTGGVNHFTVLRDAVADQGPSRALADALDGRSAALQNMGQIPEAILDSRRALAVAREIGYPAGEALALGGLSLAAGATGDLDGAVRWARQAARITDGIPGAIARLSSYVLTEALTRAGDLAEAGRVCAAGLARARAVGDMWNLPVLLLQKTVLDLQAGNTDAAATHINEAIHLALRGDTRTRADLLNALECCGHLCAQTGRAADAVTVWAAAHAIVQREGPGEWSVYPRGHESVSQAQRALGPTRTRDAEERGAAMSLATAAEFALMLTDPSPQRPAVSPGLGKLSIRERELVSLVAQGHTNAQIADQLYISVRTVSSHLDRIRDKTGCRRRADLTRLALSSGLI